MLSTFERQVYIYTVLFCIFVAVYSKIARSLANQVAAFTLGAVYMEVSYPGKRAGSVAETNYFLHLYGSFHPVSRDEI